MAPAALLILLAAALTAGPAWAQGVDEARREGRVADEIKKRFVELFGA